MKSDIERSACIPVALSQSGFNSSVLLPHDLQIKHLRAAMESFLDFLGFVNQQLYTKDIQRMESMLMPANFSSIVGEYMSSAIPKQCSRIVKNRYHNGHPDLIPADMYPGDVAQHATKGIEIKAFKFLLVVGAQLERDDWRFSGRSSTSRRTITASVTETGYQKMMANWIYKA